MPHELLISPSGRPTLLLSGHSGSAAPELPQALVKAMQTSQACGLLHLATNELQAALPPGLAYLRSFASHDLTALCQTQGHETTQELPHTPPPPPAELATWILQAPPMTGLEYLNADTLLRWWADLDTLVRKEIRQHAGGVQEYLSAKNPQWHFVGRVTFHLAENKRDEEHPFAFLATYASRLSAQGRVQHEPLARALQQSAEGNNHDALLSLLIPLRRAAKQSALVKELVDSGDVYHAQAWSPSEAFRLLKEIPLLEESGLLVRVPDWWKPNHPNRVIVDVKINSKGTSQLGADALLDFSLGVAIDGEPMTEDEIQGLLASMDGLVRLKGKWVEIDHEKLQEALQHWKEVESQVQQTGLSFYEGMRLLSGATLGRDVVDSLPDTAREWAGLSAGPELRAVLDQLGSPEARVISSPAGLKAELRPYQRTGLGWLHFLAQLGLGGCLADDMGLGKTVQVIALLLALKEEKFVGPSLLVVPASLIANWKAEIERFAPALKYAIVHPSEMQAGKKDLSAKDISEYDLIITTYGMLIRLKWLHKQEWRLAILDEAQAIKNAGTQQARAAKELKASCRIAMTGTPVENRLSDLWSLFDFVNPGLLGSAKAFAKFVKQMEEPPRPSYQPLRSLVGPYILRRLKTDKRVIADLPDKTEMKAYCGLSRQQAALYQQAVRDLDEQLQTTDGIQRKGVVLTQLMRFKQICNHPTQMLGHGEYDPKHSGKFQRLAQLCEEMAERQEKVLVFTQFKEIAEPLVRFLEGVFCRPGLMLHGGTAVAKRRELVASFQRENGPPFFVLSVKAGGTGLNLTAATQVIHFDRWWNPAVEDQATDRAFRIGQKRNVLVHKFVCRGTVEERIDSLITQKSALVRDVVEGTERMLTEMGNEELLRFVALDMNAALET